MLIEALGLSSSMLGAGCAPAPEGPRAFQAAEAFAAGVEHVAAERWPEAERAFLNTLVLDSGMPLAHYGLGQARMAVKRYDEAAAAFEASREAFLCAAHLTRESERAEQRRLDAALATLRDSLREMDRERFTHSMIEWEEVNGDEKPRLSEAERRRQAIETQIAGLERLKRRGTGVPPEVDLALGSAYFNMGALGDAERQFSAVLAADPESGDAHNNLAVVFMLTGRLAEAERSVEAAEKRGVAVSERLKEELRLRKSRPPAR